MIPGGFSVFSVSKLHFIENNEKIDKKYYQEKIFIKNLKLINFIHQYLVNPPLLIIICSILFLKLSDNFSNKLIESEFHVLSNLIFRASIVVGIGSTYIESLRIAQRFPIGFRSGLFPGHTPTPHTFSY